MWRNTRMVVLSAIAASLYAAVLVPFKVIPLIPGVTELRPANAIPIVCSFLFGPAAGWGSAIGNMIGDFFGGVGPGDFFGFFANLMYGYLPYRVWNVIAHEEAPVFIDFGERWVITSPLIAIKFTVACLIASTMCADLVGWGENMIGLRPFVMLGNIIIFNNMMAGLILSPFLLAAIYPRVRSGRLLYQDVMPEHPRSGPSPRGWFGLVMLIVGAFGAWLTGNLLSTGYWFPRFLPHTMAHAPYDRAVAIVVTPFMILAAAGVALI
jgi:energy-coupling factor transport system substrate-specific component